MSYHCWRALEPSNGPAEARWAVSWARWAAHWRQSLSSAWNSSSGFPVPGSAITFGATGIVAHPPGRPIASSRKTGKVFTNPPPIYCVSGLARQETTPWPPITAPPLLSSHSKRQQRGPPCLYYSRTPLDPQEFQGERKIPSSECLSSSAYLRQPHRQQSSRAQLRMAARNAPRIESRDLQVCRALRGEVLVYIRPGFGLR
jgi:hypothetical protein